MILSNKRPEELSKNRLLSLAMVLQDIKTAIDNQLTVGEELIVSIKPDATNAYFWSRDDCFGYGDTIRDKYVYDNEELIVTRIAILKYIRSENIITGTSVDSIGVTNDHISFKHGALNILFKVREPEFSNLYLKVTELAQPLLKSPIFNNNEISTNANTVGEIGKAKLRLEGRKLIVSLPDSDELVFKIYKSHNGPHNLMQYLLEQPENQQVSNTNVLNIEGCEGYKDLQAAIRTCGFDKHVKPIFFPLLRRNRLLFNPSSRITLEQRNFIIENANKNGSKRK